MQWQTVSGWNVVVTLVSVLCVLAAVRHMLYRDCIALSRKLHTEVVAQIAVEHERTRNLERWLERTERIVMELRPRIARLEAMNLRGEEREQRGEEREVRAEARQAIHEERGHEPHRPPSSKEDVK